MDAERVLQAQLVDAMTRDILPRAERSRDTLRAAFGKAQAKVDALDQRVAAAQEAVRERQRRAGEPVQSAWIVPQGTATLGYLDPVDRLLLERQSLVEREWVPANTAWVAQETHLQGLTRRLSLEAQLLGRLDAELAQSRAAEAAPPPDSEAQGGRLHGLRQTLAEMGLPRPGR